MSSLSEEYISSIVSKIAVNNNLKKCCYTMQKFESMGQNYFGIVLPVTVTGCDDKQNKITLSIALKLAPTDERYRVSGAVTLMFQREVFVYSTLFKQYREIQHNINSQFIIPTLFFASEEYCKEVIAMQDMCSEGYKPYTDGMFLDLEHITIALKSLAQLHSLSFVLREKHKKLYEEVAKVCIPLTENTNKRYMDIMRDRLMKALCKFSSTEYVHLIESLKLNCGRIFDKATDLVQGTCISHGDVWKENILFKYKDNKPISSCLIDYQTMRVSSPAFDTLYLIISSTDTNLRQAHYYQMLDTYYKTFDQTLKSYKLESEVVYPKQAFNHDLKVVAPACLITVNTSLWLSNGLQEEGHVISKHIWTTPKEKNKAVDKYKCTVKGIIDDFYNYRYLPGEVV